MAMHRDPGHVEEMLLLESLMVGHNPVTAEELLCPPSWHRDALCKEHPAINFHPRRGEDERPAKAVCRRCLVRQECLDYALADSSLVGVWGATSHRERRLMRAVLRAA